MVKICLKAGANMFSRDLKGKCVSDIAIARGNKSSFETLRTWKEEIGPARENLDFLRNQLDGAY